MKKELYSINFNGPLLNYANPVEPMNPIPDDRRYKCTDFCCECERRGLSNRLGGADILMSHGCSGEDIAYAMRLDMPEKLTDSRVMFLFENPGKDYGLGSCQTISKAEIGKITKKPPVGHYYWTMAGDKWPISTSDIVVGYGDYIAYLIYRFGLSNVYITNCIKCKYSGNGYRKTAACCMEYILKRELDAFRPDIILCFGQNAYNLFLKSFGQQKWKVSRLLHPAQRTYTRERYYEINQKEIERLGFVARRI